MTPVADAFDNSVPNVPEPKSSVPPSRGQHHQELDGTAQIRVLPDDGNLRLGSDMAACAFATTIAHASQKFRVPTQIMLVGHARPVAEPSQASTHLTYRCKQPLQRRGPTDLLSILPSSSTTQEHQQCLHVCLFRCIENLKGNLELRQLSIESNALRHKPTLVQVSSLDDPCRGLLPSSLVPPGTSISEAFQKLCCVFGIWLVRTQPDVWQ